MDLRFDQTQAIHYKSKTQIARILSEDWVTRQLYCPLCGAPHLTHYRANKPVADFHCETCHADFELKSKQSLSARPGHTLPGGAYHTMIERITAGNNPHLLVMTYAHAAVNSLTLIPANLFVPALIEPRPPLPPTARRAGWVGCTIAIASIPASARIDIICRGIPQDKKSVLALSQRALSLSIPALGARGWLLDTLSCIDRLSTGTFHLEDLYAFEPELQRRHPRNHHIRDKIRQQLQYLRDKGFITFIARGLYRKGTSDSDLSPSQP